MTDLTRFTRRWGLAGTANHGKFAKPAGRREQLAIRRFDEHHDWNSGGTNERAYLSRRTYRCDTGCLVLFRPALRIIDMLYSSPAGMSKIVCWTPVIAGAIAAAALSSVLLSFGVGIGLSVASTSPTWRDASAALALLSGLYLILQALVSFGVGGYVAGRVGFQQLDTSEDHSPVVPAAAPPNPPLKSDMSPSIKGEQRDGLQGLLAWALAVVLGVFLATGLAALASSSRSSSPSAMTSAAEPLLSYELDALFRSSRRTPNIDLTESRAAAGRILLTSASRNGVAANDRAFLISDVAALTGLAPADAERRVDETLGKARATIRKSRQVAVILTFSSAAALLLGAVIAWLAAVEGGRHRDGEPLPRWLEHDERLTQRRRVS